MCCGQHIASFLECLRDDDLEVRRAALLTLNALVHNDSALVRPLLTSAESKTPEEPPAVRPCLVMPM